MIVEHNGNTLLLELPHSIYGIHEKLMSVGIASSPDRIPLTDNDGDEIRVKLYSENDFGNHLLRTLSESDTISDANSLAFIVSNSSDDIKDELEQNILYDQYSTAKEVISAVRQMTYDAGPVKTAFYCPLVGNIDEGEGDMYTVGNRYLSDYAWAIEEAIELDAKSDDHNMAEYFDRDDGVKRKLASMSWGIENYHGKLFGKIECSLREALTDDETEILKDWISGQNSDGWGEGFEQRPIDTEDGDLYVSFWHSGSDYSIMSHDELDDYIDNQSLQIGGM